MDVLPYKSTDHASRAEIKELRVYYRTHHVPEQDNQNKCPQFKAHGFIQLGKGSVSSYTLGKPLVLFVIPAIHA